MNSNSTTLVFESDGVEFTVRLNDFQKNLFDKNRDAFIEMLSDVYKEDLRGVRYRESDGSAKHTLSDAIGECCDGVRLCSHCGNLMLSGYYMDGEYACSDECCLALYNGDEEAMREDLSHAFEDEWECYYTEWESYLKN